MPEEKSNDIVSTTVETKADGSKEATATTSSGDSGEGKSSPGLFTDEGSASDAVTDATKDAKDK